MTFFILFCLHNTECFPQRTREVFQSKDMLFSVQKTSAYSAVIHEVFLLVVGPEYQMLFLPNTVCFYLGCVLGVILRIQV